MSYIDEIGNKHNRLTVVSKAVSKSRAARWLCRCDCGNMTEVDGHVLRSGGIVSCGCARVAPPKTSKSELGNKYSRLVVVGKAKTRGRLAHWVCLCDCGNQTIVSGWNLRSGNTKSCGCLLEEYNLNRKNNLRVYEIRFRTKPPYRKWRQEVINKHGGRCVKCGSDVNLTGHHILSYRKHPEIRVNVDNGICLCFTCHGEFHSEFGVDTNETQIIHFLGD